MEVTWKHPWKGHLYKVPKFGSLGRTWLWICLVFPKQYQLQMPGKRETLHLHCGKVRSGWPVPWQNCWWNWWLKACWIDHEQSGHGWLKGEIPNNAIWVFPPQNGWFIREIPIKMADWGYPYFWKHPYTSETSMFIHFLIGLHVLCQAHPFLCLLKWKMFGNLWRYLLVHWCPDFLFLKGTPKP